MSGIGGKPVPCSCYTDQHRQTKIGRMTILVFIYSLLSVCRRRHQHLCFNQLSTIWHNMFKILKIWESGVGLRITGITIFSYIPIY
ncbi:hypothetical protein DERP_001644 [Dermatophagoides pteronyssinus]|uniref:Uncharacterized protein n=1 Tax=Dermatophagoides pteronyssinus TaxID=6956 RepID=A0ABQ8JB46_DERPT|nr:hypothetical protein DERP_001644 [Dermatophagoides pteronyssinus]